MSDLFRLDGRCAPVTGASGRLGRNFAAVPPCAGAAVALAARHLDKLEAAAEIGAAGGQAAVILDIADADGRQCGREAPPSGAKR